MRLISVAAVKDIFFCIVRVNAQNTLGERENQLISKEYDVLNVPWIVHLYLYSFSRKQLWQPVRYLDDVNHLTSFDYPEIGLDRLFGLG